MTRAFRAKRLGPIVALAILWPYPAADAAALSVAVLACKAPADALKATTFRSKKDAAGLAAFAGPLTSSRACMTMPKGVTVGIDEKRPPLSCVRLVGDLECYWVPDALVDLYPGEKGGAGGAAAGKHRH
jgi:hypothetical protein